MAEIGEQDLVIKVRMGTDADPSPVFTSETMTPYCWKVLKYGRIDFLVVDRRLSTGLPRSGVYFQRGESGEKDRKRPISVRALKKLAALPGSSTVYDNGTVVIYDVRRTVSAL
jgi:hypothetical protein